MTAKPLMFVVLRGGWMDGWMDLFTSHQPVDWYVHLCIARRLTHLFQLFFL